MWNKDCDINALKWSMSLFRPKNRTSFFVMGWFVNETASLVFVNSKHDVYNANPQRHIVYVFKLDRAISWLSSQHNAAFRHVSYIYYHDVLQ